MEDSTSNKNINTIKEVRRLFNELSNLSSNEKKRIRRKL